MSPAPVYDADGEWQIEGTGWSSSDLAGELMSMTTFTPGNLTIKARYRENNIWSAWGERTFYFDQGFQMMMAPNPAYDGTAEISLTSLSSTPVDYNVGWDIEVVDMNYGKKMKKTKVKKKEYNLKTHGWKAGNYIVIAKYKGATLIGKLNVK